MITELSTVEERENLDVDVLFVGGGPANLAAAIHLMQLAKKAGLEAPNVAVVEKAGEIGAHQISGAVLNPSALRHLFPDYLAEGCPIESEVTGEEVRFLTEKSSIQFPIIPPPMRNHGNAVISLAKFTRWLGEKAAAEGVNLFTGFAGTHVLYDGDRVVGISTGDKGINAKGEKKPNFEAGVNIRARCTVFGEGVRGYLTKSLIPKLGLAGRNPQTFETGVKEVWECAPGRVKPGHVVHTMGYPLANDTVGGTFVYGMKDNLLVIGMVVSLNYEDPYLEPYKELQKFKEHPLIARLIDGGKQVAYGAKAIASGGYYAIPKLVFDGGMLVGESGALLDMSRLKGIHTGMWSGIFAAEAIVENLKSGATFTKESLAAYPERFFSSPAGRDIYKARNFHQALSKGFPLSFLHLGLQQITGGRGLVDPMPTKIDRKHYRTVREEFGSDVPPPDPLRAAHSVDKLTSVFNAGTLHDEDQTPHLKIRNPQVCLDACEPNYKAPCNRFCPAGVYEMIRTPEHKRLQVNFTNCVHCQTCDIKCPTDNILWTPPEAGGGPRYAIL